MDTTSAALRLRTTRDTIGNWCGSGVFFHAVLSSSHGDRYEWDIANSEVDRIAREQEYWCGGASLKDAIPIWRDDAEWWPTGRITEALLAQGHNYSRRQVQRLMPDMSALAIGDKLYAPRANIEERYPEGVKALETAIHGAILSDRVVVYELSPPTP